MTTIFQRVSGFIERLSPEPVCDDCIVDRLALTDSDDVANRTRQLAGSGGFEIRRGACALCGEMKSVILKS